MLLGFYSDIPRNAETKHKVENVLECPSNGIMSIRAEIKGVLRMMDQYEKKN